jgi:hypothetical protein
VVIGGVNWGLVGFFNFNLITAIFGAGIISSAIFAIVGLASLYCIYSLTKVGTIASMKAERGEERIRRAA